MTKQEMQWAKQHDWFIQAAEIEPGWYVVECMSQERDVYSDGTYGEWVTRHHDFESFDELQAWAGY